MFNKQITLIRLDFANYYQERSKMFTTEVSHEVSVSSSEAQNRNSIADLERERRPHLVTHTIEILTTRHGDLA